MISPNRAQGGWQAEATHYHTMAASINRAFAIEKLWQHIESKPENTTPADRLK
jgi:hypothetical protein